MNMKRVHVIVNPASGQDKPILKTLNTVFQDNGIEWEMFVTKEAGDGVRLAKEAAAAGVDVVAVYGGDGTVREVTTGLLGTEMPILDAARAARPTRWRWRWASRRTLRRRPACSRATTARCARWTSAW